MSLSSCNSLGYEYPDDFCLRVTVEKDQNEFDVDPAWMAGATFLGLFLGAGIVLLCAKPFLASWEKKKVSFIHFLISILIVLERDLRKACQYRVAYQ